MYLTETIAASEVSVEAESLWCAIVIDDNRRQIRLDLTWDELPAIADTLTRAYLAHLAAIDDRPPIEFTGYSAPVGHIDDAPLPSICPTCDGNGCEESCGLSGGCEHVYAGPDSHKVCRKCMGRGLRSEPDAVQLPADVRVELADTVRLGALRYSVDDEGFLGRADWEDGIGARLNDDDGPSAA